MAKYLFQVSYTVPGEEGLRSKGGNDRRDAVANAVLLTPEQVDEAVNRAVSYRPPGL